MQIFNSKQAAALDAGEQIYNRFIYEVEMACNGSYVNFLKKHWLFSSMPGLTKTTTIIRVLDKSGLVYYQITGKKSMRDFLYQLCYIVDKHKPSKQNPIIIFIDDNEFIFSSNDNMNIFKVMIGKQKLATYANDAALTGLNKMPADMKKTILKYRLKNSEGFQFSTDNIHFIIATNVKLPSEEEARLKEAKSPGPTAEKMVSKAAIADRMNNYHIDFESWQEQWGYVANQILKNPYFGDGEFDFSYEERVQMVKFTWENFDKLKSKSFRCYEGLAQDMIHYPNNYLDKWNSSVHLDLSYSKIK